MALPLLLPILFGLGSATVNTIAANRRQGAIADAMAAERTRQAALDEESYALNKRAQGAYEDTGAQKEKRGHNLASMYKDALEKPPTRPIAAAPPSSSSVVTAYDKSEAGRSKSEASDSADRLGNFRSFGDLWGTLTRSNARDAGQTGLVSSFKRGSQGVLPLELSSAQQQGQGLMMLGDILSLGSAITTPNALVKGGWSAFGGV